MHTTHNMLAIAFYCMSSVALSVMIANATGPAMDVSQFVKPTATVPWTLSTMDIPPPSTPTPVTRSAYSYYYNALPAWPRFSSLGLRRKRATPKRTMTLRKVYRGGPYSPRAGYRQEDDYVQQMRGFNSKCRYLYFVCSLFLCSLVPPFRFKFLCFLSRTRLTKSNKKRAVRISYPPKPEKTQSSIFFFLPFLSFPSFMLFLRPGSSFPKDSLTLTLSHCNSLFCFFSPLFTEFVP
ncbi:MAG: hypothetical protein BYD32DRAFT_423530 [Podila humilis]|nr:MAG: hypothetical protein BYD32DRAFT_423530 [Podila humilis]